MKKATTTTKKSASLPPDDEARTRQYIRETCKELDEAYDREALRLLCGVGVFAADDPSKITEAVERLHGPTFHLAFDGEGDRQAGAVIDVIDTAYLLGIAVGRRLGPGALRVTGGDR